MTPLPLPPVGFAVLLGIIQGLTEFLPISSSGHLAAAQLLFPALAFPGVTLELATHLGTTVAVIIYYRKLVAALVLGSGVSVSAPGAEEEPDPLLGVSRFRWAYFLVVGTLPTVLIGVLGRDLIRAAFDDAIWVASGLAITGCVLMTSRIRQDAGMGLNARTAILIGVAQGLAIFPGVSRSGLTITASLLLGIPRRQAVTFSFLLSIPAISGAMLLDAVQLAEQSSRVVLLSNHLLFATLAAGFVGYSCIGLVHRAAESGWWYRFGWYCWIAAAVLLVAAH